MGPGRHLLPLDCAAGPMDTEYGVRRVFQIPLRVIADGRRHLRLPGAGLIAPKRAKEPALAPGICDHLPGVAAQLCHRRAAR